MTDAELRNKLIEGGVKNLQAFGYPNVNTENILTDDVYKAFFEVMLENNLGNGRRTDEAINSLISEINQSKK